MVDTLFSPRSIAVIGATDREGKLGYAVLYNILTSGYRGKIYPVNPGREKILGLTCFRNIKEIPDHVDLAVIIIPGEAVLGVLEACGEKGVRSVIIISAGFRETGPKGLLAERRMIGIAKKYGMRILGPNCLGVIDTITPMNASFARGFPLRGKIAFMSQSGAVCLSVLDIALAEEVGFSRFVSLGNRADLNEIDFLKAWADDPETKVVLAYLEGIADGSRFMEAAREITKRKPIIAIKSGTTSGGSRAVSSHTGSLAGSERAYEAAFKQTGVIRADSIGDLFDFAIAFSRQPLPRAGGIAIITNAGGPGIMATDAAERSGLSLASFHPTTLERLRTVLPAAASILNPVDMLGDANADRYRSVLPLISADPNVGGIIVILTPQFTTRIEEVAFAVVEIAKESDIPILACFMGKATIRPGVRILTEHRIPNYIMPERAVAALKAMVEQHHWQNQPLPEFESFDANSGKVGRIFDEVRAEGRLQIGDAEARAILQAYRIPVPPSKLCKTAEEAEAFAEVIGYPVVMKIASPDILHKTDIGGVRLNIRSAGEVRDFFDLILFRAMRYVPNAEIWGCLLQKQVIGGKEVILGMNRDPQFGPLVMFGLGGIYVEVLKDVTFRIAPFSRGEANEMIREIRAFDLLQGVRGQPRSDLNALADTLLKVSQFVAQFPEIVEMDINPLVVFEEGKGVMGIDMRLVLAS
jgi:acetyltransferase